MKRVVKSIGEKMDSLVVQFNIKVVLDAVHGVNERARTDPETVRPLSQGRTKSGKEHYRAHR
jgi:hypothetical protein